MPGAPVQSAELLAQRTQFLALLRMLVPALEQVLGVQQDVHAFDEERLDQQRIAALAGIAVALGLERGDAFLMQCLDTLQQRVAAGDRVQWPLRADLLQADAEQLLGVVQQLRFAQVEGEQVGLVFLDQFFQRRGDLRDRQDAGHVCAALEGMQGTLQGIGDRLRQFAGAVGEEADQGLEMGFRLVGEDLQQLRIEQFDVALRLGSGLRRVGQWRRLDAVVQARRLLRPGFRRYSAVVRRRRFRQRLALGQGMRGGRQQVDIVALALGIGGELLDQPGNRATTWSTTRCTGSLAAMLRSSTRLNRFSIDQASSPITRARTIRPLPLRVWKARRTSVSASRSSWSAFQAGR